MRFVNNVFDMVIQAAKIVAPEAHAVIQWNPELNMHKKEFGLTFFPSDGSTPIVELNPKMPVDRAIPVLAHELAHVIAGQNAKHGPKWFVVWDAIHANYNQLMEGLIENAESQATQRGAVEAGAAGEDHR